MMHPRLEEIRKRLLTPPNSSTPARYKALVCDATEDFSPALDPSQGRRAIDLIDSQATANSQEDAGAISPAEVGLHAESTLTKADGQVADAMPTSSDGLAQAVAELFEPARQCQERLLQITRASKFISHLTRLAVELREPLGSFHDNIRKLSSSFESMRTLRDELGTLAESFAPVRALHQQVIQMAHTVRIHLAEVADGLEPAKALKLEIAELTTAIDSLSELQARFYELSEAFGDANASSAAAETLANSPHSSINVK